MFTVVYTLIKIDLYERIYQMKKSCVITNCGRRVVPKPWPNKALDGTNRLYYIEGGTGGYIEDGKRIPFEHGKLYFIPYYACISPYTDETDRIDHSYVDFTLSPPIMSKKVFCIDPHTNRQISAALHAFREFCHPFYKYLPPTPEREQTVELLSSLTVYLTEQTIKENKENLLADNTITTALNLMHNTLSEKLTVAEIAAKCYMSTDGFIRKFTRIVGETPYAYLKKLKVRTALMLRSEGLSLESVAKECGYSDASSLIHAIRASQKKSPPDF
jgi:AraC-like DNA-binding protein